MDDLIRCVVPAGGRGGLAAAEVRSTFALYPTGVTVIGAGEGELMRGMTASSFTSVSLAPPLALVCVRRNALMRQVILQARSFAVSVLAADQEALARHFADRQRPHGPEQFDLVEWWPAPLTGAPLLAGCLAWLDCCLAGVAEAGDHDVMFGQVAWAAHADRHDPLLYFARGYQRLSPQPDHLRDHNGIVR
jgi:flavin reductase (DIM6/NTAB) family NADH-FMN oxidoreductase RutF